jgi:hypothetical protein
MSSPNYSKPTLSSINSSKTPQIATDNKKSIQYSNNLTRGITEKSDKTSAPYSEKTGNWLIRAQISGNFYYLTQGNIIIFFTSESLARSSGYKSTGNAPENNKPPISLNDRNKIGFYILNKTNIEILVFM